MLKIKIECKFFETSSFVLFQLKFFNCRTFEENKMFNLFEGRKKFENRKDEREPIEKKKLIDTKDLFDIKE